jgi:hypothetical protein
MRVGAAIGAGSLLCALTGAPAVLPAAQAQEIHITAPSTADAQADRPLTPAESALLGKMLASAYGDLAGKTPALHLPSLSQSQNLDIKRSDNADGSSAVTVKQPFTGSDWEANVGADLNTAAPPPSSFQPDRPISGAVNNPGSGAAWASLGVPNLAAVDARLDPLNEQGKIGTTLKHSMPIGEKLSVTVAGSYSLTENYNQPASPTSSISGQPVQPTPAPATPTAQPSAQVWNSDKSVKLEIAPTGTTLGADIATASNDPVTHDTFSADQKIYGPLHVTTAVSDIGLPSASKSITAGLKFDW